MHTALAMPSDGPQRQQESDFEKDENVNLKVQLEGPRGLREWTGAIASVRKH